jgi:hypothetical protein
MLLTLGGDTLTDLDAGLAQLAARTRADGLRHDFALIFDGTSAGLTVHCNPAPNPEALKALRRHCERRKYMQRAEQWHGLLVRQDDGMAKAGMELRGKWTFDAALDAMPSLCGEGAPEPRQTRARRLLGGKGWA